VLFRPYPPLLSPPTCFNEITNAYLGVRSLEVLMYNAELQNRLSILFPVVSCESSLGARTRSAIPVARSNRFIQNLELWKHCLIALFYLGGRGRYFIGTRKYDHRSSHQLRLSASAAQLKWSPVLTHGAHEARAAEGGITLGDGSRVSPGQHFNGTSQIIHTTSAEELQNCRCQSVQRTVRVSI
jgi:hypothetical protein